MKHKLLVLVALAAAVLSGCCGDCCKTGKNYKIKDGVIVFNEPKPAAGQQDMLQFAADPIDTVRVGFIGLGMRGPGAVSRFTHIDGTRTVALCDLEEDRVKKAQEILAKAGKPEAAEYFGEDSWKQLCERDDINLVYICTPWNKHVEMAVYAMQHGKHVAVEVPAATSVEECWQLVDVSEQTRKHCMMLENCVYDLVQLCAGALSDGLSGFNGYDFGCRTGCRQEEHGRRDIRERRPDFHDDPYVQGQDYPSPAQCLYAASL